MSAQAYETPEPAIPVSANSGRASEKSTHFSRSSDRQLTTASGGFQTFGSRQHYMGSPNIDSCRFPLLSRRYCQGLPITCNSFAGADL